MKTFVDEVELGVSERRRARPLLASGFEGVFADELDLEHFIHVEGTTNS